MVRVVWCVNTIVFIIYVRRKRGAALHSIRENHRKTRNDFGIDYILIELCISCSICHFISFYNNMSTFQLPQFPLFKPPTARRAAQPAAENPAPSSLELETPFGSVKPPTAICRVLFHPFHVNFAASMGTARVAAMSRGQTSRQACLSRRLNPLPRLQRILTMFNAGD